MTKKELTELERQLEENGYRKATSCLSSGEDWGWFKNFDGKYQIEFRIWDLVMHMHSAGYGVDVLVLPTLNDRIDLTMNYSPDAYTIEEIEKLAAEYYEFAKKWER